MVIEAFDFYPRRVLKAFRVKVAAAKKYFG
jgi:hypothetical protein